MLRCSIALVFLRCSIFGSDGSGIIASYLRDSPLPSNF
jgi:hypothetical protein